MNALKAGHDGKCRVARFIGTPRVAKHRLFVWLPLEVCVDSQIIAIARDDDTTFGVLHSRFHEAWSLRLGTSLEDRPRYTPTTTFETFPFPEGLTPNLPAAAYADDPRAQRIAPAAKRLDELRRAWLNPPDLVDIVPEIVPTAAPGKAPRRYPDRIVPKNVEAAVKLKQRTLTNLYNQRPRWLADAHEALDRAVAERLRLAGGHFDRGRAATPARPQPRTRRGSGQRSWACRKNGLCFSSPAPSRGEAG